MVDLKVKLCLYIDCMLAKPKDYRCACVNIGLMSSKVKLWIRTWQLESILFEIFSVKFVSRKSVGFT